MGEKLTDADRKEILDLYRHTRETTTTLAERYGVENSTISRFLKASLSEDEYEILISAKRAARTPGGEKECKQLYQLHSTLQGEKKTQNWVTALTPATYQNQKWFEAKPRHWVAIITEDNNPYFEDAQTKCTCFGVRLTAQSKAEAEEKLFASEQAPQLWQYIDTIPFEELPKWEAKYCGGAMCWRINSL